MKFILIASLVLASLSSFAAPVSDEALTVNRLLLNSPDVIAKLNSKNIKGLYDIEATPVKQGVTKYVLKYNRDCFCMPASAVVTVIEDLTPTFRDGPALYKSSVTIKEGQE